MAYPATNKDYQIQKLLTSQGRIKGTTRVTGNTTLDTTHHTVFCDTDGGAFTISLPNGVDGTHYRIANVGTSGNDVTLSTVGGIETIYKETSQPISDGEVLDVVFETTEQWN